MAASLGLNHETYSYSFPYSSPFPADPALDFPAAAVVDDCPFDYSPPPVFAGAGEDEMTMSCGSNDARRMRARNGRIGFRTRSEVEILDDGFKWRKYGKKAVKSSPNPRNYYRCSTEGCGVKKRVERDPQDSWYVITTYDGVHNHATPCAAGYGSPPRSATSPAVYYGAVPWATPPAVASPEYAWGAVQAAAYSSESC